MRAAEPGTYERAASEELSLQIFNRLRKKVPKHLRPTQGHWAAHWRESNSLQAVAVWHIYTRCLAHKTRDLFQTDLVK